MIYVASSWRNKQQPRVVSALRSEGYQVYDFRDADGFHWSEVDPDIEVQGFADYGTRAHSLREMLDAPAAQRGFRRDVGALKIADTCVLVLPCGRSAHLELGMAIGWGKRTAILLDNPCQPELMYRAVDFITPDIPALITFLR